MAIYLSNFEIQLLDAAERNRYRSDLAAQQRREADQKRLAIESEKKLARAAVQTKSHKKKVTRHQKPKDVPAFLKNLVNKNN